MDGGVVYDGVFGEFYCVVDFLWIVCGWKWGVEFGGV